MNRQDWDKSKKQMRKLLDQGIGELKELAAEASYLTDATSNVVKLEMEVHRFRSRLEKAQRRLGREVARAASSTGTIKPNATIKKLIKEIHNLEAMIGRDEKKIKKVPLSWAAARKAVTNVAKRAGITVKTGRRRKAARKKASVKGKRISRRS